MIQKSACKHLTRAHERSKPDSETRLILDQVWELTQRLQRGVTLDEIRTAFEGQGLPVPRALPPKVSSLKRRGVLSAVGGRPSHALYALDGMSFESTEGEDDAVLILEAVRKGWKTHRRPLSTREVTAIARKLGSPVPDEHPNAVRKRLQTLASSSLARKSGVHTGRVRHIRRPNRAGRAESFWLPARARWNEGVVPPATNTDWIRTAVGQGTAELGFPVSRRDLVSLSARLRPDEGMIKEPRVRQRFGGFAKAVKADSSRRQRRGTLSAVRSRFTCSGGAELRAVMGAPTELEMAAVAVMDTLVMLQAESELKDMLWLERRIAMEGRVSLLPILDARRASLRGAVVDALGEQDPDAVAALIDGYLKKVSLLPEPRRRTKHHLRGSPVTLGHARYLRATLALVANQEPVWAVAGQGGLATQEELVPFDHEVRRARGAGNDDLRWVAPRARRFPNPDAPEDRPQGPKENKADFTLVDRVDAFTALVQELVLRRAGILVPGAQRLLGYVVRDPKLVTDTLAGGADLPRSDVRSLTLALGMLGSLPGQELLDGPDVQLMDIAAWVLARVFAGGVSQADAILDQVDQVSDQGAALIAAAYQRIRAGRLLGSVE